MQVQINHPETYSYTVADIKVVGYKSSDMESSYVGVLISPRDETEEKINLTFSKNDWIEFVAVTAQEFVRNEK